jgi:predicted AAA+ superfamily ATPase
MSFQRTHYINLLTDRLSEERRFIQVIAGPRQVGKTTIVRQLLEQINVPNSYTTADGTDVSNTNWLEQQWQTARLQYQQKNEPLLLVIDEIQKINNWSDTVKKLWDEDTQNERDIRVILLGSSRLMLQAGLSESLAGRYELIQVVHWSYSEMNEAFGISPEEFVFFGSYPGAAPLMDDEQRWRDYVKNALVEAVISKDIIMLNRIHKPALLKNLFDLACHYSGQILSYNKILGQLQDAGNTTTLSHYQELLQSSGLITGLEKFYGKKVKQRGSSPKWQVYNNALMSTQLDFTFQQAVTDSVKWGRMVESAIGAHLVNMGYKQGYKVFYWRDRSDEVDFVITKNNKVIGIEVKTSNKTRPTKGMAEFKKRYNPEAIYMIGQEGLHWTDFIKMDPVDLFM